MKPSFLALDRTNFDQLALDLGQSKFRGKQLADWVLSKGTNDLTNMSNISKEFRDTLDARIDWSLPEIVEEQSSDDGSTKLLLKAPSGHLMETVILRYENRVSLCVSSQVGCKLACGFCQTGKLGFVRHLSREEILSQFYLSSKIVQKENRRISHVVFMGMGEPLDNYDNAVAAANTLIDEEAYGLSARHVTLSTSGIAPAILRLATESKAALAVSLHAANDSLRTELMPINRKYPLAKLKEALKVFQKNTSRKITIEYILIKDVNCEPVHAKELIKFLHGLRAKVNLIPFNPHPGLPYQKPSDENIRSFQKHLSDRSYPAPVRYSKGSEVSAACGQLAAKSMASLNDKPLRQNLLDHLN